MIRRLLIANRGEIALRVMRTCREMGIGTVAVYSEADAGAPHVEAADDAVCIGPAAAAESYLKIPAVISAAKHAGADAIHPGYGFLSENADFARACEASGLTFVGPPASVIERMGSKTAAREAARQAGVPVVPGGTPRDQSAAALAAAVAETGLPALLKATAGGGGKGMRTVRSADEVAAAIESASREALRAFGDGTLYVERQIDRARHVEVQIFGDRHGNIVHLFERDCSLQRRHQKVIEEAPAPRLAPAVRARLHEAALAAARGVGYVNAGTIEFLVEGEGDDATFYFLEMNTRLQVEHPVTEAVTGLDLVRAQIEVASGAPLPFSQRAIAIDGHAVECRVYAEDSKRLLPQSGRLLRYREPEGPGIRVDSGVREGQDITVHYDPMLAKVVSHGATRDEAIDRAIAALNTYEILGIRHNVPFLVALLERREVRAAKMWTRFIESALDELSVPPPATLRVAAALAAAVAAAEPATSVAADAAGDATPAARLDPWDVLGPVDW